MNSFILEFNKLSVSKKKQSRRQVEATKLHVPSPIKVVIDASVLKINQCKLSTQHKDYMKVNNVLTYIYLDRNDDEFVDISNLLAKSNLYVTDVRKVDNPYLKKAFELKRNLRYGSKLPRRLFHGTKEKYLDNICTYNFDWRLGGTEKGHRHGKGVNFSPSASFATIFCDKGREKVMILADVLIDKIKPGNINTLVPPRKSDTTSGQNQKVFVKFYDNEFYPTYVIDFEK